MLPSASSNRDNPSIQLFMVLDRDNSIYCFVFSVDSRDG